MERHRIVVLGGAGDMGSRVVRELSVESDVDITIADFRSDRALALASKLGSSTNAQFVDATSRESLREALTDADVVVNCVGPFYKFAFPIASAAIAEGVNYVDICDDDDATMELLTLDRTAMRAGVTAVIGMGWTPGISNLLAMRGAAQLDRVTDIDLTWVGSTADSEGIAVIAHVIHAVNRPCPVYLQGEWKKVPALSHVKRVEFPAPIGSVSAYVAGHPEAVTLPRFFPNVQNVVSRGYLLPHDIQNVTSGLLDLGLADEERKVAALAKLIQPLLPLLASLGDEPTLPLSAIRVDVTGSRAGAPRTVSYAAVDSMERLTGIPPAIVALMLARGQIREPGVFPPEGCLDQEAVLAELARREVEIEQLA